MHRVFCAPSRYVQGEGVTERLAVEMAALGLHGPVLVVAGRSAVAALARVWAAAMDAAGWLHRVRGFGGECTAAEIDVLAAEARSLGAAAIVGAGGGKCLDAARAAAAAEGLPFVSCPTVASTDAPTSALSVVYDAAGVAESYRIHGRNPDLVLVDSGVIVRAPVRTLVAGMGDALSTWYEARAAASAGRPNMRGGAATEGVLALARACRDTVLADGEAAAAAARERRVTPAVERIIEANTLLSGLGFESAGLAAAHAVHNGLTVLPGPRAALHGEKVAFGTLVQMVLDGTPPEEFATVVRFCRAVGLPVTLAQLGVPAATDADVAAVAARATRPGETIHNLPRPVTSTDVAAAIRTAERRAAEITGGG
ncbi:MAG: glycerol dehydrogenase [Planctomycetia bacterium]|nr:glycerol dehydrogenase [Planctomycetia bacterium]